MIINIKWQLLWRKILIKRYNIVVSNQNIYHNNDILFKKNYGYEYDDYRDINAYFYYGFDNDGKFEIKSIAFDY